jgi:hypothetical protein
MKQIQITGHYTGFTDFPFWRIEGRKNSGFQGKAQIPEKEERN